LEGVIEIGTYEKLDARVRSLPSDLTMSEADRFLRHNGFVKVRQRGSHCVYKRDAAPIINIQGSIIPEYQVAQMIIAVDRIQKEV